MAPPLVRRRLRQAFGRVLPRLLPPERRQVEERPVAPEPFDAATRGEVRPEDAVAVSQEHAEAEALAILVLADPRLLRPDAEVDVEVAPVRGVPRNRPGHARLEGLDAVDRRTRDERERRVPRIAMGR